MTIDTGDRRKVIDPSVGISPATAASILREPALWTEEAQRRAREYAADRIDLAHARGAQARRVVCAACKMIDGTLILGARHWDGMMIAASARLNKERSHDPNDQGFVDQKGVYMTREEAWIVAREAGQILYRCGGDTLHGGCLFSENLY